MRLGDIGSGHTLAKRGEAAGEGDGAVRWVSLCGQWDILGHDLSILR
jgi:hypothetical protein